jgi:hypothetical protein
MAHACNPSYSRGRDQEEHGLKADRANRSQDPVLENFITKIGLVESTPKKEKRNKQNRNQSVGN